MGRGWLGVVGAGVLLEAGCLLLWVLSPQLTAAYNADYSREFFSRAPAALAVETAVLGWLGPLGNVAPGAPGDMVTRLLVGLALMTAGYLLGLWAVRGGAEWLVLAFALLFRVTLASLPGLFSTDIFSYVMYGRITALYGRNPYVDVPMAFPADPFLAWVFPFWRDQPTVYGPLWTDFSWVVSRLTGQLSNFDQVLAYRLCLIGFELTVLGLVWWLAGRGDRSGGQRTMAFAMYAWNPLVLFDLVGSTHNDVVMLMLLLLGLALRTDRMVALTLSAWTKFATGVVALLWSVVDAAAGGPAREWARRLATTWGVAIVLTVALWWPWLQTPGAIAPLTEAAGGRLVLNSAPDLVALFVADQIMVPGGIDKQQAEADARSWIRALSKLLYGGYVLWELRRLWVRSRARPERSSGGAELSTDFLEAATRALLLLPLLVFTWVWSWYFSWPLVLAVLLGGGSRLARLVVAYTLVALPIVYAHQYLNDDLSGGFVLLLALGPLLTLVPIRPTN